MVDNKNIGLDMYSRNMMNQATILNSATNARSVDILYTILNNNTYGYKCDIIGDHVFIKLRNGDRYITCKIEKIDSFNCASSVLLTAIDKNSGVLHEMTIQFRDMFIENRSNQLKFSSDNMGCFWKENPSLNDLNAFLKTIEMYTIIWERVPEGY